MFSWYDCRYCIHVSLDVFFCRIIPFLSVYLSVVCLCIDPFIIVPSYLVVVIDIFDFTSF